MDVTVIICCHNSASRIKPTLEYLARQNLYDLNCELLLVDNNCIDNTVQYAQRVWADNGIPFPLTIVEERNLGLSNARKTGVLNAKGEILVFCDDDNWLYSNYLQIAFDLFKNDNSVFGSCGFCYPVADIDLPVWFEKYAAYYACGLPLLENKKLLTLRGAGMVVRAKVLRAIYLEGISHFTSDRKGGDLSSGGDDEISFWLEIIGGKIIYSESLKLKHFIDVSRLTVSYRESLVDGIHNSINELRYFLNILKYALRDKRKLDYIMIFSIRYKGVSARLKLGLSFFTDKRLLDNYWRLKKLKQTNWILQ